MRGTKYNTGIGHRKAIDIGAAVTGHWSGAHAVQWDMNAPPYGDVTFGAMPITTVASGPRKLPTSRRSNQPATARDDHTARFRTPW